MTEEKKEELTLKIVLEDCIAWLESLQSDKGLNEEIKKRHEGKTIDGKYFNTTIGNLIKKEQDRLNQTDSNLKEVKDIKDSLDKINKIAGDNAPDKIKNAFGVVLFMGFRQTINQFEENINKGAGKNLTRGGFGTGRKWTSKKQTTNNNNQNNEEEAEKKKKEEEERRKKEEEERKRKEVEEAEERRREEEEKQRKKEEEKPKVEPQPDPKPVEQLKSEPKKEEQKQVEQSKEQKNKESKTQQNIIKKQPQSAGTTTQTQTKTTTNMQISPIETTSNMNVEQQENKQEQNKSKQEETKQDKEEQDNTEESENKEKQDNKWKEFIDTYVSMEMLKNIFGMNNDNGIYLNNSTNDIEEKSKKRLHINMFPRVNMIPNPIYYQTCIPFISNAHTTYNLVPVTMQCSSILPCFQVFLRNFLQNDNLASQKNQDMNYMLQSILMSSFLLENTTQKNKTQIGG